MFEGIIFYFLFSKIFMVKNVVKRWRPGLLNTPGPVSLCAAQSAAVIVETELVSVGGYRQNHLTNALICELITGLGYKILICNVTWKDW